MRNEINYSVFLKKPGEYDQMRCRICGSVCNVKRNELDYTCWAEAMAKHKRLHDRFECPHTNEKWHDKCVINYWAWRNDTSSTLVAVAREELLALLEGRVDAEGIRLMEDSTKTNPFSLGEELEVH